MDRALMGYGASSGIQRGVYLLGQGMGPLHILSFRQGGDWVCHCLEYDFTVRSAESKEAALLCIGATVRGLLRQAPVVPQIPPHFRRLWDSAWKEHGTSKGAPGADGSSPRQSEDACDAVSRTALLLYLAGDVSAGGPDGPRPSPETDRRCPADRDAPVESVRMN